MSFGRIFYGILSHVTIHVLGVFCRKQTVLNILVSQIKDFFLIDQSITFIKGMW